MSMIGSCGCILNSGENPTYLYGKRTMRTTIYCHTEEQFGPHWIKYTPYSYANYYGTQSGQDARMVPMIGTAITGEIIEEGCFWTGVVSFPSGDLNIRVALDRTFPGTKLTGRAYADDYEQWIECSISKVGTITLGDVGSFNPTEETWDTDWIETYPYEMLSNPLAYEIGNYIDATATAKKTMIINGRAEQVNVERYHVGAQWTYIAAPNGNAQNAGGVNYRLYNWANTNGDGKRFDLSVSRGCPGGGSNTGFWYYRGEGIEDHRELFTMTQDLDLIGGERQPACGPNFPLTMTADYAY